MVEGGWKARVGGVGGPCFRPYPGWADLIQGWADLIQRGRLRRERKGGSKERVRGAAKREKKGGAKRERVRGAAKRDKGGKRRERG